MRDTLEKIEKNNLAREKIRHDIEKTQLAKDAYSAAFDAMNTIEKNHQERRKILSEISETEQKIDLLGKKIAGLRNVRKPQDTDDRSHALATNSEKIHVTTRVASSDSSRTLSRAAAGQDRQDIPRPAHAKRLLRENTSITNRQNAMKQYPEYFFTNKNLSQAHERILQDHKAGAVYRKNLKTLSEKGYGRIISSTGKGPSKIDIPSGTVHLQVPDARSLFQAVAAASKNAERRTRISFKNKSAYDFYKQLMTTPSARTAVYAGFERLAKTGCKRVVLHDSPLRVRFYDPKKGEMHLNAQALQATMKRLTAPTKRQRRQRTPSHAAQPQNRREWVR